MSDAIACEDAIEDQSGHPGKILLVNDADKDDDGFPDFYDGYSIDGSSGDDAENDCERLVPVTIDVPDCLDSDSAQLRFTYDAADPAGVARVGQGENSGYASMSGKLRLWCVDAGGVAHRVGEDLDDGGDFVASDTAYTLSDLMISGGTITLYMEAVAPSSELGDLQINVELDPDGEDGDADFISMDSVRLTAMADHSDAEFSGDVRLFDGIVNHTDVDLMANTYGTAWGHTRTWTDEVGFAIDGLNGNGMEVDEWPHLIQATSAIIVIQGGAAEYFDYDGSGYTARFHSLDTLSASGGGFTLVDSQGNTLHFEGFAPAEEKRGGVHIL